MNNNSSNQPINTAAVQFFCSLSEAELQERFIEPLLRYLDFVNVRDLSGANDKGKDLVATKEEFGKSKLYAIQIKKFKFSGKHQKTNSLTAVLNQLRQIFCEKTIDVGSRTERLPDRCLFITPYPINRSALESAFSQLAEYERREITIIDGPLLADQILKYMPNALAEVSADLHYRTSILKLTSKISESNAFGASDLILDDIYIDMNLEQGLQTIETVSCSALIHDKVIIASGVVNNHGLLVKLEDVDNIAKDLTGGRLIPLSRNEIPRRYHARLERAEQDLADEIEKSRKELFRSKNKLLNPSAERSHDELKKKRVVSVDLTKTLTSLRERCRSFGSHINEFSLDQMSVDECRALMLRGKAITAQINAISLNSLFRDSCGGTVSGERLSSKKMLFIRGHHLLKLGLPVLVLGPPGAGKTTLMRRLVSTMASRDHDSIPVLLSCNRIVDTSVKGIKNAISEVISDNGWHQNQSQIEDCMSAGRIRLFFDGLDEAGIRANDLFSSIRLIEKSYSKTNPIVTARDTHEWKSWEECVQVKLSELTDEQQSEFIANWFSSEPSKCKLLAEWFSENLNMKNAARTPIIAALLCSLVSVNAELPTTSLALYEERFELLLGRWEQAKGIPSLPLGQRQRYFHFLMDVAITAHKANRRSISRDMVTAASEKFHDKEYHKCSSGLIDDCIRRGIFEQDSPTTVSFGHLTYQEYLVARWLHSNHSSDMIFSKLGNDWWKTVLVMYATRASDLTTLIQHAMKTNLADSKMRDLLSVVAYAKLTEQRYVNALKSRIGPW